MSRRWVVLFGLCGCLEGVENQTAPRAVLRLPVTASIGSAVDLDASGSSATTGEPLTYVFEVLGYGDAAGVVVSESSEPIHSHRFAHTGIFTVRLHITDLAKREALAVQDIIIRNHGAETTDPCVAATDCTLGDTCEGGTCFSVGGSID